MTRFAWLQSRTQTLGTLAVLAALAVAAAITGVQLSHLYGSLVAHCQSSCDLATNQFLSHDHVMDHLLDILTEVAPALFGIFWGAPLLARELETGAYRLAWTQSVTRSRWLLNKLALVGIVTLLIAALLTLTVTWWYSSFHGLASNQYAVFDRRDVAPVGYAVFAFTLGALVGVVIRRTVPAMAATLGGYVIARLLAVWIRPHLLNPVHETLPLATSSQNSPVQLGIEASPNESAVHLIAHASGPPNSWTLSDQLLTSNGHVASSAQLTSFVHQYCAGLGPGPAFPAGGPPPPPPEAGIRACLQQAAQTFHLLVTYQPASRYWTFQWLETGIFLVLALGCAAACYWWVTRRVS